MKTKNKFINLMGRVSFLVGLIILFSPGVQAFAAETVGNLSYQYMYQPAIDVISDSYDIGSGSEFTTDIMLYNPRNIYAEDINIEYNDNLFEFIEVTTQGAIGITTQAAINVNGLIETTTSSITIYHQDTNKTGKLRFIVVSKGESNGLNNSQAILKLKFRAKNNIGEGQIRISSGLIADGYGNEFYTLCGGKTFRLLNCDVNGDGRVSLGDLAITGRLYGNSHYYWQNSRADINKNGYVEDMDLREIVKSILSQKR